MLDRVDRARSARAAAIGVVAPNGTGKSHAAADPRRRSRRPTPGRVTRTPPSATVGYLPQEPERRAGETVRALPRAPHRRRRGRARARRRSAARSPRGAPGADDAYADALERVPRARRGRPRRAGSARCCADLGLPARVLDARDAGAVGRSGRAGEPRRDPARPLRRVPARRAHERPRLRGPRPARAVPARRARRRRGDRLARPRVPRPHGHVACSSSTSTRTRPPSTPAAGRPTSPSRRPPAATPRRTTPSYVAQRDDAARPGAASNASGRCRARRRSPRAARPTSSSAQFRRNSSEHVAAKAKITDRALDRLEANAVDKPWEGWDLRMEIATAPRSGAVVARLAGAVVQPGRRSPSGPSTSRSTTANGSRSLGANGSGKTTLLDAALGRLPLDAGERGLGPGVIVGELDQARGRVHGRPTPLLPRFEAASGLVPNEARSLLAKFGLGADHVDAARRLALARRTHASVARAASARGRQLPRARRADQPSRPARRSSSSNRRSTTSRARSCSSPTTGPCSTRSR